MLLFWASSSAYKKIINTALEISLSGLNKIIVDNNIAYCRI